MSLDFYFDGLPWIVLCVYDTSLDFYFDGLLWIVLCLYDMSLDFYFDGLPWIVLCVYDTSLDFYFDGLLWIVLCLYDMSLDFYFDGLPWIVLSVYDTSLDFYFDGLPWIVLCVYDTSAVSDVFIANIWLSQSRESRAWLSIWLTGGNLFGNSAVFNVSQVWRRVQSEVCEQSSGHPLRSEVHHVSVWPAQVRLCRWARPGPVRLGSVGPQWRVPCVAGSCSIKPRL